MAKPISISISAHQLQNHIELNGLYYCKIRPFNRKYITDKIIEIREKVPKCMSGTLFKLEDISHIFSSNDEMMKFVYILYTLKDRQSRKPIFEISYVGGQIHIKNIISIKKSTQIYAFH